MIKNIYKTSLSLLTDLYQLTMAYGYWKKGIHNNIASFNVFFRENPFSSGYAVCSGLENIISFLENFKFSRKISKPIKASFFISIFFKIFG